MTDLATYLAGLRAGDVVAVTWNGIVIEKTVDRVTPTQVVIGNDRYKRTARWSADLGYLHGRRFSMDRILTPESAAQRRAEQRRKEALREARDTLRSDLTLDTIPAMRAALDRAEAALREGEQ